MSARKTRRCERADHPERPHWHYGYGGRHWCTDRYSPLLADSDGHLYSRREFPSELDVLRTERDALAAAVDRVRALHSQDTSLLAPGKWCPACGEETPCPTIRALAAPARRPDTQQGDGDGEGGR